jgi:leucyl-tRNA synthetase
MLSDSPPERDFIWTEAGVEGAHRFVQRIWRLVSESAPLVAGIAATPVRDGEAAALSRSVHKAIKAVGEEIERLGFNRALARLYELVNALSPHAAKAAEADASARAALREGLEALTKMIAPMMPHLAEECWATLGGEGLVANQPWPRFDAALVVDDEIVLPVQINGKKRGDLTIARDADQSAVEAAALSLDVVRAALDGKTPRKVIVVPQRIVNVVV